MSKIYFLGDSFCEHDGSWVEYFRKKYNLELASLGVGGSSLAYTVNQLHTLMNGDFTLNSDDRFIICLTQSDRFFSKGRHFGSWVGNHRKKQPLSFSRFAVHSFNLFHKKHVQTADVGRNLGEDEQIIDAYRKWMKYLWDGQYQGVEGISKVSHIINTLIPMLPSEYVSVLHCFEHSDNSYTTEHLKYIPEKFRHTLPLKKMLVDLYGEGWNESDIVNVKNHMDWDNPIVRRAFKDNYEELLCAHLNLTYRP